MRLLIRMNAYYVPSLSLNPVIQLLTWRFWIILHSKSRINILISDLKLRFLFRLLATPATKSYSVQERAYVIEVLIFIYLSSKLDVMTF